MSDFLVQQPHQNEMKGLAFGRHRLTGVRHVSRCVYQPAKTHQNTPLLMEVIFLFFTIKKRRN